MKDKIFTTILTLVLLFVVALSSFNIQMIQGAQLRNDSVSKFRMEYIKASRGLIFDRNGKPLVQNKSSFTLYLEPLVISDYNQLKASITSIETSEIEYIDKKYNEVLDIQKFNNGLVGNDKKNEKIIPDRILIDKNFNNPIFITQYLSDPSRYKGLRLEEESQRVYLQKELTAHLIGYTGEVVDEINLGYRPNTEIGKAGVELSYDSLLRGNDGKVSVDTDTQKRNIESSPVNGKNLYLSVDIDIQKSLYDILKSGMEEYKATGAAGLLQDVNTGEVLAYISLPSYDDNLFVGGIGNNDFDKLNKDPNSPMLDRIIDGTYPPGSDFKLNTATALLETGSITKDTMFPTGGLFKFGDVTFRDFSNINQGTLDVVGGLCRSSNIFFMKSTLQMDDYTKGLAINKIIEYGSRYGLGKKTGIDMPEGYPGYISSPSIKKELTGEEWLTGDLLNASIGQGYTLLSPIQVQTMVTAIANGGNVLQPRVVMATNDSLEDSTKTKTSPIIRNSINVSKNTLDIIKEGMYCGVHTGIIQDMNSSFVQVAAKSGTAEFGAPDPATGAYPNRHGWVTGYFPYDNPKYSFTLLLEKGGSSGNTVKVARKFIDWLYKDYKINEKIK
ncbi:MAG: penicillin-binding transpeptidase domain-containing protein [bacterium]